LKGKYGECVSELKVNYDRPYLIGDDALLNSRKCTHTIVSSHNSIALKLPIEAYSKLCLEFGLKHFKEIEEAAAEKEIHMFKNF